MMIKLVGRYQMAQSNLFKSGESIHLVIAKRSKPTPQKPLFYLLQRVSPKEHNYISSLFEVPQNSLNEALNAEIQYHFDFAGKKYLLSLNHAAQEAFVTLSDTTTNSLSSINNRELGANFTPHAGF